MGGCTGTSKTYTEAKAIFHKQQQQQQRQRQQQQNKQQQIPVSSLYKSIVGRYRPVKVADGPKTARGRFIKNASLDV